MALLTPILLTAAVSVSQAQSFDDPVEDMVDGGAAIAERFDRGASVVVPALHALGVARLDLVVATHADVDHRGGLPAVLRAVPTGTVWVPHGSSGDPGFRALRRAAVNCGRRAPPRGNVVTPPPCDSTWAVDGASRPRVTGAL